MKISWLSVARVGAAMVGAIVPGVQTVEALAERVGTLKGKDKEDAVVGLVVNSLESVEGLSGKQLLSTPEIEAATREVIKAVHDLHEAIAKVHAPQPAAS